jgi:hypothetical protein
LWCYGPRSSHYLPVVDFAEINNKIEKRMVR